MAKFQTIDDLSLEGQTVLVRVDLNVPMADGVITDSTRLDRILATVKDLSAGGARVVLLSHFGRPKGERRDDMSLAPIAEALSAKLEMGVAFAADCIGDVAEHAVAGVPRGGVLLLENLRFHAGEEGNDPVFAQALAALGDLYVNDAFSAAHRAHASTAYLANLLPSAAGRLMAAELDALEKALGEPERPVVAVVGGAKVSTKLKVLKNMVTQVDKLVIGGAMANTFLLAAGTQVGRSLVEAEMTDTANEIMAAAKDADCELILPVDAVVAASLEPNVATQTVSVSDIPDDQMILDVGPNSVTLVEQAFADAKTIVWNGPLGAFEIPPFDVATVAAAKSAAARTQSGQCLSVAGGGDTVAALAAAGVVGQFSYVSTAGGAFLEWLEGETLPGVAALS